MLNSSLVSIYLVHYSKLEDRREFLAGSLLSNGIEVTWITEKDSEDFSESSSGSSKIFGVSSKVIGMDLGTKYSDYRLFACEKIFTTCAN
jgi:hypothetical protein